MANQKAPVRHRITYRFARLIAAFSLLKYRYRHDRAPKLTEPCLIVSNHLTESDAFAMMRSFPQHMYFVCGEHLCRTKFGPLLGRYLAPIPAPRGGSTLEAVKQILKRLKEGHNVAIFPEGCRSFNGVTLSVSPAIGKLVKKAGCGLVTHKLTGGYFIAPRWSYQPRTGPLRGHIEHVYTSGELKALSAEEITALINRDLYEDAYARQQEKPLPYRCGTLAEGLENFLLICPECGAYDSMQAAGDTFRCTCCGLSGRYDEYGFLKSTGEKPLPFDNVRDWGRWMETRFDEDLAKRSPDECLFTEKHIRLYAIDSSAHTSTDLLQDAELKIWRDRIEIGTYRFDFSDVRNSSLLYFGKSWLFSCSQGYFGLTGEAFHAWKLDRICSGTH